VASARCSFPPVDGLKHRRTLTCFSSGLRTDQQVGEMSRYRVSTAGLLACAIAGLSLMAANPAHADVTVTETCNVDVDPDTELTLFVGEKLTVNMLGNCTRIGLGASSTGELSVTDVNGTTVYTMGQFATLFPAVPAVVVYTATDVGTARVQVFKPLDSTPSAGQIWRITVLNAPEPPPDVVPSTATQGPAPLIQQFGKPDVGSCEDVASPDLNWAGVASGGWSESWAQWMHDGNGGAVCTRTLEFHRGYSRWMVK
jgi:hypothetical protein